MHDILKKNTVDLWLFSLKKPPAEAFSLLDDQEQERAQQLYFEHHRRRFIAAHAILRRILSAYLLQKSQDIVFQYGARGKPYVKDSPYMFNLSHSGEIAVCAVGMENPIGVDVECMSVRPYLALAQSHYAREECERLQTAPECRQAHLFFRIWTQKEAVMKAIGEGLAYPSDIFHTVLADEPGAQWKYEKGVALPQVQVYPGHALASSVHGEDPRIIELAPWHIYTFQPQPACMLSLCCDASTQRIKVRYTGELGT